MAQNGTVPMLSAVSSSARQLFLLLRCISFASKTQVRITADGLRFSAEESSVMEAFVFLSKTLFQKYTFHPTGSPHDLAEETSPLPTFQISLLALLETLQIFSLSDASQKGPFNGDSSTAFASHRLNRHNNARAPFSASVLGTTGLCRLTYAGTGSPLSVHLSEAGVSTTCDLTTYTVSNSNDTLNDDEAEVYTDIPFDRTHLLLKTITRSSFLADCISELATASPTALTLLASPRAPYLSFSATGPLGSASVDFSKDVAGLLETFQCQEKFEQSYSFEVVKKAKMAMGSASKVSIRVDGQGVLSLQFLIEVEEGGGAGNGTAGQNSDGRDARDGVAFVDFRIVPLLEGEAEGGGEGGLSSEDE